MNFKMRLLMLIFCFAVFFCKAQKNIGEAQNKPDSINQILQEWRKDSLGCLNLRNTKTAEIIANYFNLQTLSLKKAVDLLGNPTYTDTGSNYIYIDYFFNTNCDKFSGKIYDNTSVCGLQLTYQKSKQDSCTFDFPCYENFTSHPRP